ncbi:copper resistance protein B [Pseudoxanthomonas sp. 10H]|uniref:copper resistance protein B n=1 Tax=Pseudoxanthomonas sp. 10H TaxID=3242729 RepID=UPI003558758E
MTSRSVLAIHLLLLAGGAGAQTHVHRTSDGHDHAAASGSGQAVFDAAVTRAPHVAHGTGIPDDAPSQSSVPHGAHDHAGGTFHGASRESTQQGHPSAMPGAHPAGAPMGVADTGTPPAEPVPVPSAADRAAAFPTLHGDHHAHGNAINSLVRFNRFEAWDAEPGTGQAWEGSAWVGGDTQRLWLRSEGEREHGRTAAADLEVLYGRGISAWWELLAGVRHDFAPGPSRDWAAIGMQGLAPYKFEVSATAYLGSHGDTAFVAEAEYELLLTNRLILQPLLEVELRGQDDPARGVGSGLSTAEAGLRLRYEVSRRFAPYVGLVHERSFERTADHRRAEGEAIRETRWVAGVRWWF